MAASHQFRKSLGTIRKLLGNRSQAQLKWAVVEKNIVKKYTLSIITSQLHCCQLRTTFNGKDFKFFFPMGYAQRSRTSFFDTCMKENSLF